MNARQRTIPFTDPITNTKQELDWLDFYTETLIGTILHLTTYRGVLNHADAEQLLSRMTLGQYFVCFDPDCHDFVFCHPEQESSWFSSNVVYRHIPLTSILAQTTFTDRLHVEGGTNSITLRMLEQLFAGYNEVHPSSRTFTEQSVVRASNIHAMLRRASLPVVFHGLALPENPAAAAAAASSAPAATSTLLFHHVSGCREDEAVTNAKYYVEVYVKDQLDILHEATETDTNANVKIIEALQYVLRHRNLVSETFQNKNGQKLLVDAESTLEFCWEHPKMLYPAIESERSEDNKKQLINLVRQHYKDVLTAALKKLQLTTSLGLCASKEQFTHKRNLSI